MPRLTRMLLMNGGECYPLPWTKEGSIIIKHDLILFVFFILFLLLVTMLMCVSYYFPLSHLILHPNIHPIIPTSPTHVPTQGTCCKGFHMMSAAIGHFLSMARKPFRCVPADQALK